MIDDIDSVIDKIHDLVKKHKLQIVLLSGPMGSGKTFLVQQYMKKFFDFIKVTSPTYATCNTYKVNEFLIKHFDFYLKYNEQELNIAIEDSDLIFIEWWNRDVLHNNKCVHFHIVENQIEIL